MTTTTRVLYEPVRIWNDQHLLIMWSVGEDIKCPTLQLNAQMVVNY